MELRGEGTPEAETRFVFLRPWAEVLSGYLRPVWLLGTFAALALLAYTNLSFWAKLRRDAPSHQRLRLRAHRPMRRTR